MRTTLCKKRLALIGLLLTFTVPVQAQDVGRVAPASLLVPLPTSSPVPPTVLRGSNPDYLTMTGTWKFKLTHGEILKNKQYQSDELNDGVYAASSSQSGHGPALAFDGDSSTRWCASDATYPQSLQVNLGQPLAVTGVDITWEKTGTTYRFQIEGKYRF